MERLAFIEVVDSGGKARKLPAVDIKEVAEQSNGALITMLDGREIQVSTTAATVFAAIDALWDAYLVAVGNP